LSAATGSGESVLVMARSAAGGGVGVGVVVGVAVFVAGAVGVGVAVSAAVAVVVGVAVLVATGGGVPVGVAVAAGTGVPVRVAVAVVVGGTPLTVPVTTPVPLVTTPRPPVGTTALRVQDMLPITRPVPETWPLTVQLWPMPLAHAAVPWPLACTCASACCAVRPGANTTETRDPWSALPLVVPVQVIVVCPAVSVPHVIVSRPPVVEKTAMAVLAPAWPCCAAACAAA